MAFAIQTYLEKPITLLRQAGFLDEKESPLVNLLEGIKEIDEPKVLAIAQVIQYIDQFDTYIINNTQQMHVDDRFNQITQHFQLIREDAKMLREHQSDHHISLSEKIKEKAVEFKRGTIPDRMQKIKEIYSGVCKDTQAQINIVSNILEAYLDFRTAIKQSEGIACELKEFQKSKLEQAKENLKSAQNLLENYKEENQQKKIEFEIARDNAIRTAKVEENKYNLLEQIAQHLGTAYQIEEVGIQKVEQTNSVKKQIYMKAVAFYETNKPVLSIMGLALTTEEGLFEATKTIEIMKEQMDSTLQDLAEFGKVDVHSAQVAHESMYKPETIERLINAINQYEREIGNTVTEARKQAEQDFLRISQSVEAGKKERVKIITANLENQN
ncbi:MAG: hypothetical protein ACOYT4_03690 [Nanoarchaeota archaeon]